MRLTMGMVDVAVKRFVSEKYDSIVKLAEDERDMAGGRVYDAIFGKDGDYMLSLREGWYSLQSRFYYSPQGSKHSGYVHVCECVRVPIDGYVRVIPVSSTLEICDNSYERYIEANHHYDVATKRRRELIRDLDCFARQFTTVEKLAQHNEALAAYCGPLSPVSPNVPALTFDQIFQNYPEIKTSCKG